jgi:membrane protein required for beta-lactamase induction
MFVVWNGLGCLVIPVIVVGAILAGAIRQFVPNQKWLQLIAVAFTSLALLGLGYLLNRRQTLGRDQWGNEVQGREEHSLYWIPVQNWSVIVALAGLVLVFKAK